MLDEKENGPTWECGAESIPCVCPSNVRANPEKIKPSAAEIAQRLADYVRVLKPRIIIVADRAVFAARPLERLAGSFLPLTSSATVAHVRRLVERNTDTVRGIVLADPTGWDTDELARVTGREVITLNGGGARCQR